MYKKDLALNNQQWLICHWAKPNRRIATNRTIIVYYFLIWNLKNQKKKKKKKKNDPNNFVLNKKMDQLITTY